MNPLLKRIAVLGSTGSIGRQALEIVERHGDELSIVGLAAGANTTLLRAQIHHFRPRFAYVDATAPHVQEFKHEMRRSGCQFMPMEDMVTHPDVDLVLVATVGKAGLMPTLAALRAHKPVALANKEALVMAGEIVTAEARRNGVEILPVDSEHSAVWQSLRGEMDTVPGFLPTITRLILTASGGAFRDRRPEELARVTPDEALAHPTWLMGRKITVDSATLLNKGLEIIEAHWLFGVPYERIEVLIHRESIVHSMVEFVDGSVKAQMSLPDMRLPIQYALSYPRRFANDFPKLDLPNVGLLTFSPVDYVRYPLLHLAVQAGKSGGTMPAVVAAADEEAVNLFLSGQIGFLDIAQLVEKVTEAHQGLQHPTLEQILEADTWARQRCLDFAVQRA
ncbi:MAG: 1-deoxy-D-xylulose-5-phosphate reductoisomerase [Chloroflexi bacterium]|nr:1-deoxy-D-xylulose-5-phosphate reductoisomerase [Chloroflexota bacterium]